MQINATAIFLIVRASREEDPQDADHDNLWYRLVACHVSFVKVLNWVLSSKVESGRPSVGVQENIHVLFEVQEVFIFADIFTLMVRHSLGILHRWASLVAK